MPSGRPSKKVSFVLPTTTGNEKYRYAGNSVMKYCVFSADSFRLSLAHSWLRLVRGDLAVPVRSGLVTRFYVGKTLHKAQNIKDRYEADNAMPYLPFHGALKTI